MSAPSVWNESTGLRLAVAVGLHEAWKKSMAAGGFAPHPFLGSQAGRASKNLCIEHMKVPSPGNPNVTLTKTCPFTREQHHPDICDFDQLTEKRRREFEDMGFDAFAIGFASGVKAMDPKRPKEPAEEATVA